MDGTWTGSQIILVLIIIGSIAIGCRKLWRARNPLFRKTEVSDVLILDGVLFLATGLNLGFVFISSSYVDTPFYGIGAIALSPIIYIIALILHCYGVYLERKLKWEQ